MNQVLAAVLLWRRGICLHSDTISILRLLPVFVGESWSPLANRFLDFVIVKEEELI